MIDRPGAVVLAVGLAIGGLFAGAALLLRVIDTWRIPRPS